MTGFVNGLLDDMDVKVDYIDERYTTKIPLRLLGKNARRKKIDKFSAAVILSDYLQRRKEKIGNTK